MAITGIVVLFIGLVFIISYPINKRKNSRCTAQTQGRLDRVRKRYNKDGNLKSMHVYAYRVDGIDYELATLDHSPDAHKPGDVCTIWYNPAKPKDAQAYRASAKYLKVLLYVGLALVLVGLAITVFGLVRQFA